MTVIDDLHYAFGMKLARVSGEIAVQALKDRVPERELSDLTITELLNFAAVFCWRDGEEAFIDRARASFREMIRRRDALGAGADHG